MRLQYNVAVLFTSDLQIIVASDDSWPVFARDELGAMPEHEICFLFLEKDEPPKWLSLENGKVEMPPSRGRETK